MGKEDVKELLYDTLEEVLTKTSKQVEDKEISESDKLAFNLNLTLTITMYISEVIKKLDQEPEI